MFVTIINDCRDENAKIRQETRAAALFNAPINFCGVHGNQAAGTLVGGDIEAAGQLIDVLDAAGDEEGVVLVNVAPRSGEAHKWDNGTPFGYFNVGKVLVVSTIDGYTLSLIKKLRLTDRIYVMDIPTVLMAVRDIDKVDDELATQITQTQFRSFEFMPRVAHWLKLGQEIPAEEMSIDSVADMPHVVWFVDNFGNAKTSMLPGEIDFVEGDEKELSIGSLPMVTHLKDVEDDKAAIIEGSSGYGGSRFLEVVMQGVSAKEKFGLTVGQELLK
jgi:hypothetical protein